MVRLIPSGALNIDRGGGSWIPRRIMAQNRTGGARSIKMSTILRYSPRSTVSTLGGLVRQHLQIRRCENAGCPRHHQPYRPEDEGALVLPQPEFGSTSSSGSARTGDPPRFERARGRAVRAHGD